LETAAAKNAALKAAGVRVPTSFNELGTVYRRKRREMEGGGGGKGRELSCFLVRHYLMNPFSSSAFSYLLPFLGTVISEVYSELVKSGVIRFREEPPIPKVPIDFQWAKELGLIRKPSNFLTTITDDRY